MDAVTPIRFVEQFHLLFLVQLSRRIELFLSLPFDKLDRMSLQKRLTDIGRS